MNSDDPDTHRIWVGRRNGKVFIIKEANHNIMYMLDEADFARAISLVSQDD